MSHPQDPILIGIGPSNDVEPVSEDNPIPVGGNTNTIAGTMDGTASWARPSNTDAYIALDAVSDATPHVLQFTNIARENQGSGYITKARLMTNQKTNVARFRLHLFHTAPTPIADNAPQTLLYANKDKRIGVIDFAACATEDPTNSTGAESLNTAIRLAFNCAAADRNLYGLLETLDGFTPASAQQFYIELTAEQN